MAILSAKTKTPQEISIFNRLLKTISCWKCYVYGLEKFWHNGCEQSKREWRKLWIINIKVKKIKSFFILKKYLENFSGDYKMKNKLGILFALVLGLAITGSTFAQNNQTMSSKNKTNSSKMSSKAATQTPDDSGTMSSKTTTKKSSKHMAKKNKKHHKHYTAKNRKHHTAKRRSTKEVQGS